MAACDVSAWEQFVTAAIQGNNSFVYCIEIMHCITMNKFHYEKPDIISLTGTPWKQIIFQHLPLILTLILEGIYTFMITSAVSVML